MESRSVTERVQPRLERERMRIMRHKLVSRGLAGHSHFHNIRHRKARADAKRQSAFQKLSREIYASIKAGGSSDVTSSKNARLTRALEAARRGSMPKDRIERALQTGSGTAGGETAVFEGVFPGGVGVLVRASAARRNAVAGEIRSLFNRAGGEIGRAGWMFEEKLAIVVEGGGEDVALFGMEEGADEVEIVGHGVELLCDKVAERERLQKGIVERFGAQGVYGEKRIEAKRVIRVGGERAEKLSGFFRALDEHEEVVEVFHNAELWG